MVIGCALFHTSRKPSPLTHPRMNRTRTRIFALGLSIVAAAPFPGGAQNAAAASSSGAIRVPFEKYTLPNGLTVILAQEHSTPTVAVEVLYHVGSKNETRGRTGFAHLFEHVMFTGSGHVPYGLHDKYTEGVGGGNNGNTTNDFTQYYETVPSNYLEHALWLESDRMGWLLDALDVAKYNAQRDIVQNERRQSVDNQPYGRSDEIISAAMYPKTHPYSWPVIGSLADLQAASVEDVKAFFRLYYAPNNATLGNHRRLRSGADQGVDREVFLRRCLAASRSCVQPFRRPACRGEATGVRGSRADSASCISPGRRSARTTMISTRSTCWPTFSRARASHA